MFRLLIKKYFHESIYLWLACGVTLFLFPWVRIWTVSQFELTAFLPLLEQIRPFEKYSPVPLEQLLTFEGIIASSFDDPVLILCIVAWCVSRGTDLVSGEIGRGTMEMILAQPIKRSQLMMAHGLVTLTGLATLVLLTFLGIVVGIQTCSVKTSLELPKFQIPGIPFPLTNPFGMNEPNVVIEPLSQLVSVWLYIHPCLNLFAFGLVVWGLSFAVSSWDQYRWRTIGLVIGIYVAELLIFILGKSAPIFAPLLHGTFFSAYQPDWIVQTVHRNPESAWHLMERATDVWRLGPLGTTLVLALLGAILYSLGTIIFLRRDIPAPT